MSKGMKLYAAFKLNKPASFIMWETKEEGRKSAQMWQKNHSNDKVRLVELTVTAVWKVKNG